MATEVTVVGISIDHDREVVGTICILSEIDLAHDFTITHARDVFHFKQGLVVPCQIDNMRSWIDIVLCECPIVFAHCSVDDILDIVFETCTQSDIGRFIFIGIIQHHRNSNDDASSILNILLNKVRRKLPRNRFFIGVVLRFGFQWNLCPLDIERPS